MVATKKIWIFECCSTILSDESGTSEKCVTVTCPVCELSHPVPVGGFPCNHFVLNLVEIYELQNEGERPCAYCQFEKQDQAATTRLLHL